MMMRSLRALRPVREFAVPYARMTVTWPHVFSWRYSTCASCVHSSVYGGWGMCTHTTPGCELSNSACRHAPVGEACRQARGLI